MADTTTARRPKAAGVSSTGKTAGRNGKAAPAERSGPPREPQLRISMLKPSVNNMAVRVFARAAGLEFTETDVWGATRSPEFLARNPAHMTPMLEDPALPGGCLWESCAIMQYLCNKHDLDAFYPKAPERRAMIDSAMFYLVGTLYPYLARATYPALNFPQYAGEVGASSASPARKKEAAAAAREAIAEPLDVFRSFYLRKQPFIGGSEPSIADIRLVVSLEFLAGIDYELPEWARDYMAAVEKKLGQAYTEPAADVRGYIAHVKGQQRSRGRKVA